MRASGRGISSCERLTTSPPGKSDAMRCDDEEEGDPDSAAAGPRLSPPPGPPRATVSARLPSARDLTFACARGPPARPDLGRHFALHVIVTRSQLSAALFDSRQ